MNEEYRAIVERFNEYYPEIGRAIMQWAVLEVEIDNFLLVLLYNPKAKNVLRETKINKGELLPNSVSLRLKLWRKLANLHYEAEQLNELREIISECSRLKHRRDRIAHGRWVLERSERYRDKIVSYMHRHGLQDDGEVISPDDIKNIAREIGEANNRLILFQRDYHPDGPLPVRLRRLLESLMKDSKHRRRSPNSKKPPSRPRSSRA